ncbi:hypothetical protein EV175_002769 [Coemansia sp. RSA 1933]|nr:hypothetical protein EV175_002769 [Coemansia sp. RSA 1933]
MFRNVLTRTSAAARLASSQQTRNLACSTVYVKRIPRNFTKTDFAPYVEKYGPVYDIGLKPPSASDLYGIAFIKFYAGELPSSVDELMELPFPPPSEIDDVTQIATRAIEGLNETEINGSRLEADFSRKNKADSIQFYARYSVQSNQGRERRVASPRGDGMNAGIDRQDYTKGYHDGFKDGVAEGKRLAQSVL